MERFPRELNYDVQQAILPLVMDAILYEVVRSDMVGSFRAENSSDVLFFFACSDPP